MVKDFREVQSLKTHIPNSTFFGIVTDFNDLQPSKAQFLIFFILLGIVTFSRLVNAKAENSIYVIPSGTTTSLISFVIPISTVSFISKKSMYVLLPSGV